MQNPVEEQYKFCPRCAHPLTKKVVDIRERLHCDQCGFIFWNNAKPTMSMIVEKDGKVLLLKRKDEPFKDYWVLPGGYMEHDESPQECIIREVYEETGLKTKIDALVDVYLIDNDPRGNSLDVVYKGSIIEGELKLIEHTEYMFYPPNALPELIGYNHRKMIQDWCLILSKHQRL